MEKQVKWEWEIRPAKKWFDLNIKEMLSFKDLLFRLVRRDFLMLYQQTLLGPAWIILQPLVTVVAYILIFNLALGINTNGVPPFLFYLTGITLWNVFADIFTATASTFLNNSNIFSKVYFPRLIVPFSTTLLHLLRTVIQMALLIAALLFYHLTGRYPIDESTWILCLIPILVTAGTALGCGLIFSVITARYRDLMNLLHLFIRLFMFACPIFFSLSLVRSDIKWIISLNPLTPMFELFRYSLVGEGTFTTETLMYSVCAMLVFLFAGVLVFNKKADQLLDIV